MKRFIQSVFLFALVCTGRNVVQAQNVEVISLQPEHIIITSSAFSSVRVVDTRLDTNLGFIHRGGLNRHVDIKTTQSLKDELTSSINNMITGASKQDGILCINLRQFALSEYWVGYSEIGVFRFSAIFYLKQADTYRKLLTVNTRVTMKSLLGDITKRLLDTLPQVLGSYVQQAASFDPAHIDSAAQLTARYPQDLDVEEKKAIPVYNVDLPQKGLYATFDDFKKNRPSKQVYLYYNDGDPHTRPLVYELKENGMKGKEINFNKFYAVCDGEKMYISGAYALCPLIKKDNDFYFKSIGKEGGDAAPMERGSTVILPRKDLLPYDWATVVYKIDHISGNIIPVKKVYSE
jgi:hypothetical protein